MTEPWAIMIVLLGSFIGAVGAFLIKKSEFRLNMMHLMNNHRLFAGVVLYGFSPIINIIAFKGGDLTVIYPFFMFTYIWSGLLARKYLNERMNLYKWAGIALIILGAAFTII